MVDLKAEFNASTLGKWFNGREQTDRLVIGSLVLLVIFAVLWLGIWKPVSDWRAVEANRYETAQRNLDWLRANENRARQAARSGAARTRNQSLLTLINSTAEAQSLKLTRYQPDGSGGVSVVLQAQPFDNVMRWLVEMQRKHSVNVIRVSIDAEGTAGLVNGNLKLE